MRSVPTRLVLFDLDGTLIDSANGIFASLDHAFAQVGAQLPAREALRAWIGPPFHQTFPSVLGDDPARIALAIEKYREHYSDSGWAGHTVYPGIAAMISAFAERDVAMGVVTTKPKAQAHLIIDHLPFGAHFVRVYGPDIKSAHCTKSEMIAQALVDFDVAAECTAMVGDRYFDIEGACANRVRGVGVSWGFGSVEELQSAGAQAIVHTPDELLCVLVPAGGR